MWALIGSNQPEHLPGHYHQPMIAPGMCPQGWQVLKLNPAHVTAQRRVNGSWVSNRPDQLDRAFPWIGRALAEVLGSEVGRLIVADFADPARLARLGVERFCEYAARHDPLVTRPVADGWWLRPRTRWAPSACPVPA